MNIFMCELMIKNLFFSSCMPVHTQRERERGGGERKGYNVSILHTSFPPPQKRAVSLFLARIFDFSTERQSQTQRERERERMRKSRIPESVKKEWDCVRCWTSRLGYTPFKPREFLDEAIVILRHDFQRDEKTILHPMNEMVGYIQALQFTLQRENKNNAKYEPPVVLLVEFSKLLSADQERGEESERGSLSGRFAR